MASPMTAGAARKKWKGYPETLSVALDLLQAGWALDEKTSGHVSAWCPHGHPTRGAKPIQLYSTPQNDGNHARRIRRESRACPDDHDRLDAR